MDTPYIKEKEFRKKLEGLNLLNLRVSTAIEIAVKYFKKKKRDDGAGYLEEHIFPVAYETILFFIENHSSINDDIIISALFHDLFEDTDFSEKDLKKAFPDNHHKILNIVLPLTKDKGVSGSSYESKLAYNQEYFQQLGSALYETKVIKLIDRINNLQCVHKSKKEKIFFYLQETSVFYLPLAQETHANLYDRILSLYNNLSERYNATSDKSLPLDYKVIKTKVSVKDNNQPSSVYFEIGLYPLVKNKFGINNAIIPIMLTLENILSLNLSKTINDIIRKLISLNNIALKFWEKDALELSRLVQKSLAGKKFQLKRET